ncbi:hypothetical protein LINPERHAP1_LOCUS17429 [Linum perenne]
MEAHDMLSKD